MFDLQGNSLMHMWRHARAITILPGMVVIVIPALLSWLGGIHLGWALPNPGASMVVAVGVILALLGVATMAITIGQFSQAHGTLAPWDPPVDLVVVGPYRYVRNPMISGVFAILGGESAVLGSPWILAWFLLFVLAQNIYIRFDEEPKLISRFGKSYELYQCTTPRWIPRRLGTS